MSRGLWLEVFTQCTTDLSIRNMEGQKSSESWRKLRAELLPQHNVLFKYL